MALDVIAQLAQHRIIPVIAIEDANDAAALGDALAAGGLPVAEVTFRTAAAESSIGVLAKRGGFVLGAGTVLNVENVKCAVDAGATFIVSPGFNPKVVEYCLHQKIPITPGVATPTEIETALDYGLDVVKFFPAEALGGLNMLKALAAPYGMMKFIPTGGIAPGNAAEYLRFGRVLAIGGSWMVSKELLSARQFEKITALTKEAVQLAGSARP